MKILRHNITLYGYRFGYNEFFSKATTFLLGKFENESFACHSKSGGQSLWIPFKKNVGIRLMHPKGQSGDLEKAKTYFEAQTILFEHNLAPKPWELSECRISFVQPVLLRDNLNCYGLLMNRVLSGGVPQILKNAKLFGLKETRKLRQLITQWVRWHGTDALTLADYIILCKYFAVSGKEHLKEIVDDLESRMPTVFNSPDFLSPLNVCLNENGEAKVIDCDLSGL